MKISSVDKVKILGFLKTSRVDNEAYNLFLKAKNYSDEDYLDFFVSYIITNLSKSSFVRNHILNMLSFIKFYFTEAIENKLPFNNNIAPKIKELKKVMDNLDQAKYPDIFENLKELMEIIPEDYFKEEELDSSILQTKVNELENEVNELNKIASDYHAKIKELQEQIHLKSSKISYRDKKIEKLENDNKNKKEQIKTLEGRIKDLESKTTELYALINTLNLEKEEHLREKEHFDVVGITKLENLRKEYKNVLSELSSLKINYENSLLELTALKESLKVFEDKEEENKTHEAIRDNIIKCLYTGTFSNKDIIEELENIGLNVTYEELSQYLNEIKNTLHISLAKLSSGIPTYNITPPAYKTDESFTIELPKTNSFDILFVSDFHLPYVLKNYAKNFLDDYKRLLDYADECNIGTIINLGDFFDFRLDNHKFSYSYLKEKKEYIRVLAESLPVLPETTHLVLGGNHDQDNLYLGCDFLEEFINMRSDYIFLGYDRCTLNITDFNNGNTQLLLAHPTEGIYEGKLRNTVPDDEASPYLFNFYGHHHSSFLDCSHNVCTIPSFTRDKLAAGAWHVRFHLKGNVITTIEFIPLVLTNKLLPVSRTLYHK